MATAAIGGKRMGRENRFFTIMAFVMAAVLVTGFSLQMAMGRSSFGEPWYVHLHAPIFFGWVVLYVTQNALVSTGSIALHRRLGWLSVAWMPAMVVTGIAVTVAMVRGARVPFFFTPAYFIVMNPLSVLTFAGLGVSALLLRRQTDWHRRLFYCGMAVLCGVGFGRLLPIPLTIPMAGLTVFACVIALPLVGMAADLRRAGWVHPAWWWGIGVMIAMQLTIELVGRSALGAAVNDWVASGSPGAFIPALAYPPSPFG